MLFHRWWVRLDIERIFCFRAEALRARFAGRRGRRKRTVPTRVGMPRCGVPDSSAEALAKAETQRPVRRSSSEDGSAGVSELPAPLRRPRAALAAADGVAHRDDFGGRVKFGRGWRGNFAGTSGGVVGRRPWNRQKTLKP
jgi:hypothetical protein